MVCIMAYKADDNVSTRRLNVSLDEATIETCKEIGEGNLSLGIRRLAAGCAEAPSKVQSIAKPKRRIPPMQTEDEFIDAYCEKQGIRPSVKTVMKLRKEYADYVAEFRKKWNI